ncbi:hypothetical protein RO575_21280 [Methylomonas sp. MO1]|uniref:hypothetical protein n=1 Tax=Methylomonas sp. MO1 TaxID=3073619 RepID=UPI0028A3C9C2|nr:hypothetical protein [Methylomonas sp. MO1]MDT4292105.1 hypothetical protein [Methylomonas sp. MO1]
MAGRFHAPETGPVVLDSWQYQRQRIGLKLYGYVILENHLHFIALAPELDKYVTSFKAYTARRIINHLQQQNCSNGCALPKRRINKIANIRSGKKACMPN